LGSGAEPQRGSREVTGFAPEADEVLVFKTVIFNGSVAVLHEMMYYLYF